MECQVDLTAWVPSSGILVAAVVLDWLVGDPVYRWHPVRLMGSFTRGIEKVLRASGLQPGLAGCILVALVAGLFTGLGWALVAAAGAVSPRAGQGLELGIAYSLLALGDLLKHCDAVSAAGVDLPEARREVANLVGRDTDLMDMAACRRSAIESLAENLVDGFVAPLLWFAVAGIPGLVLFKAVSTMDSLVGYKNDRYRRFGWCAARLDDLLTLLPARLAWLLIVLAASATGRGSGRSAWSIGWHHHGRVPGPNPGWSEAAMAGAIRRRLAGPIWLDGQLVTEVWIGSRGDPPAGSHSDYTLARQVALLAAGVTACLAACWTLVAPGLSGR